MSCCDRCGLYCRLAQFTAEDAAAVCEEEVAATLPVTAARNSKRTTAAQNLLTSRTTLLSRIRYCTYTVGTYSCSVAVPVHLISLHVGLTRRDCCVLVPGGIVVVSYSRIDC